MNNTTAANKNRTNAAVALMMECMRENIRNPSAAASESQCKKLKEVNEEVLSAIGEQAHARSQYESAALFLRSKAQFNEYLKTRVTALNAAISNIESKLSGGELLLSDNIIESQDLDDRSSYLEEEQNLDDQWTQFEYNSRSSYKNSNESRTSVVTQVAVGVSVGGFFLGGGVTSGSEKTKLEEALSEANLTVSGELLRVTVKRPWFRPGLFEDPTLSFVSLSYNPIMRPPLYKATLPCPNSR